MHPLLKDAFKQIEEYKKVSETMYPTHIKRYVIQENVPMGTACWRIASIMGNTLFVLNEDHRLVGFLNQKNGIPPYSEKKADATVMDLCRKDPLYVVYSKDFYRDAVNIFAQHFYISTLPVVDKNMRIVDVLFRFQCFYKEYYRNAINELPTNGDFPYPYYANCIWKAAETAKKLGHNRISIMEFGVAGGNGLVASEYHALEIGKIFGLTIDVYGFDTGEGLPASEDYRDCPEMFGQGSYTMDEVALRDRLRTATLVLGDIQATLPELLRSNSLAPIGAMFVDVDLYTSTLPILDCLENDDRHFLPIIHMVFHDIFQEGEFQGEALAIKEFNRKHKTLKISPELLDFTKKTWGMQRVKRCVRFTHGEYNGKLLSDYSYDHGDLPLTF